MRQGERGIVEKTPHGKEGGKKEDGKRGGGMLNAFTTIFGGYSSLNKMWGERKEKKGRNDALKED